MPILSQDHNVTLDILNIGIPPHIHLTGDQDWVEEALRHLEQKAK